MAETLDTVVLATSINPENDVLEDLARDLGADVYRGSEEDVLGRFVEAAQAFNADVVVRVCADNPLIAPEEIDRIVRRHMESNADYSFNHIPGKGNNYPDGLGAEVINFKVLEKIANSTRSPHHKEHVTTYIRENPNEFSIETVQAPPEIAGPDIKLDVDTEKDFKKLESFMGCLPPELNPVWSAKLIVGTYRDYFKTKAVILLEHEEQVISCLKWLDEITGQKVIIALSPFAMYELDRHNIPYHVPEDYYEPRELYRMGSDNFKNVKEMCRIVDKEIQKTCPVLEKLGITPALFSVFSFKIYDSITIRLFQLLKIIEAEKPDIIFFYDSKEYTFGINNELYLFFDNKKSIYARLLKLQGWPVLTVILPSISESESALKNTGTSERMRASLKNKILGLIKDYPGLYDFAVAIRTNELQRFIRKWNKLRQIKRKYPVLMSLSEGYNWNRCTDYLQFVGIGPIFRMKKNPRDFLTEPPPKEIDLKRLPEAWILLQADKQFREFFTRGNIDFFLLMEERLQYLIERLTPTCLNAYNETARLLEKRKIEAVLTATFTTCVDHSIALAARNIGVPVICWQHGGYGYHEHQTTMHYDSMSSDFHLTWGDVVVNRYAETAKQYGTQLIPVGSILIDDLLHRKHQNKAKRSIKLDSKKKVVLYATTNYYQNRSYLSFDPPTSDNYLWQTQQAILNIIGCHNEYNVVVKLHPSKIYRDNPMRSLAKEKGFKNFLFIKSEFQYTDLLILADVLVLDFPSTTLLQSLTTSKPLFVYTGHLQLDDEMMTLLKRRAYCYKNLEDLLQDLDSFLNHGEINAKVDLKDTEFLKACGAYQLDGRSGARAADVVRDIIMRKRNIS